MMSPTGSDAAAVQRGLELALASLQSGDPAAALATLQGVLRRDPENFDGLNLAGVAATRLQRHAEAIGLLEQAVALRPDHAGAHNNMGLAMRSLGRNEAALDAYLRTVELAPAFAPGHTNLGAAYAALNKHELAITSFERSLALRPDHADTLVQRGLSQRRLGRFEAALVSLERAVAVAPRNVDALIGRGDCYRDLRRHEEAMADHARALDLAPGRELLLGSVLRRQLKLCDWSELAEHTAELARRIERGKPAIHPFPSLQIFDDPQLQLKTALAWNAHGPIAVASPALHRAAGRIHVGYFSADFHRHPMMHLMSEMLALHDRDRFRISAFAFNVGPEDDYTERARRLVDEYVELDGLSDAEAAAAARARRVDIAIDRKGYTKNNRTGILANRAAPIQVSYLAYPGTMGAPYIDYLVGDRVVLPRDAFADFTEKIVWMPHCYFPRDTTAPRPVVRPDRAAHGLPADAMVFCSFNQSSKILPDSFGDWMHILAGVEGSVLWLYADNPAACANLRREAVARGVDPARLVFGGPLPQREHLERLQLADLCLDTLPYNAHTTANDSLYVGVPILTLPGRTFAGRVCASMLVALGLPELVARDREHFVRLGIDLGRDRGRLSAITSRLSGTGATSPLYDMPRYVRSLERGFELMVDRHERGLAPDHLAIEVQ